MAGNITNLFNNKLRFGGMATGLDTDSIVKQLMRVESMKVDRVKQSRTILEWKRDDYRSITNSLRSFRDEFLDVIRPSTNFRSPSAFASYDIKSGDESIVSVKASAGATSTTHTLAVKSLATAYSITGAAGITSAVNGSQPIEDFELQGKQIDITLDGIKKTISLEDYSDISDMQIKLQAAIDNAFGKTAANTSKLNVLANSDRLEFSTTLAGSTFSIAESSNNFISSLGFAAGQKNFITGSDITSAKISSLNGSFKIKLGADEHVIELKDLTDDNTLEDVKNLIQSKINDAFGEGKIEASLNGGKLEFINNSGERLILFNAVGENNLSRLGFSSGLSVTSTSSAVINLSSNEKGRSFTLNINGIDKVITVSGDFNDINALKEDINTQLAGSGVSADVLEGKLVFRSDSGTKLIFGRGPEDSLASIGFSITDNTSNRISLSTSLYNIREHFTEQAGFNQNDMVEFKINGVTINLGKTYDKATINDMLTAINTSKAGVEMKYDSLNDRFTMTSRNTGASETINIEGGEVVFAALGIQQGTRVDGTDAEFSLDGVAGMQRSSNEFTIDGVTYTLKGITEMGKTVSISVNANPDDLVDKIKNFVAKYNELLDKINSKLSEQKSKGYEPLTDEQKDSLKDDEIKKWEEKAKTGLLSNDSILSNIVSSMRRALFDGIEGGATTLANIGITSGSYEMKGKLVINESKLRTAIRDNIDGVVQVFTKSSQHTYNDGLNDSEKRRARYAESGVAQRLYDIIQDNIRTTTDASGKKGHLLVKAGITSDSSDYKNTISEMIKQKDIQIDKLYVRLADKENALYKRFAALEKAISQMNSQSAWMAQSMGSGQ